MECIQHGHPLRTLRLRQHDTKTRKKEAEVRFSGIEGASKSSSEVLQFDHVAKDKMRVLTKSTSKPSYVPVTRLSVENPGCSGTPHRKTPRRKTLPSVVVGSGVGL